MTKRMNYNADKLRRQLARQRHGQAYERTDVANHQLDWMLEGARRRVVVEAVKLVQAMEGASFSILADLRSAVTNLQEIERERGGGGMAKYD